MKTTLSEREGNTVKLAVEVSSEELQEAFDAQLEAAGRGKCASPASGRARCPLTMVRQRLGDEAILADAVDEAMGRLVRGGGHGAGPRPGRSARRSTWATRLPELGKPFSFTATVTVMPEVVLGEYKGVEVPKESGEVDDEEVDAQMDRLRNEFAELRPVDGPGGAEG